MNLIDLFIIILILYVCYKIVVFNKSDKKETFTSKINLKDKNVFLGRNLFVGLGQGNLDEYNTLKNTDGENVLDLSKNNMIVTDNDNFKITDNICFDNFCINKKQMELIGGEIDAPNFVVEKNGEKTSVYYNHDSNTSFRDLPNKLCFKNKYEVDPVPDEYPYTCLDYHDFEVLNGERGIKLKSTKSPNYIINNKSFVQLVKLERNYYEKNIKTFSDNNVEEYIEYIEFLKNLESYIKNLEKFKKGLERVLKSINKFRTCNTGDNTSDNTSATTRASEPREDKLCAIISNIEEVLKNANKLELIAKKTDEFNKEMLKELLNTGKNAYQNSYEKSINDLITKLNEQGDTRTSRRTIRELFYLLVTFIKDKEPVEKKRIDEESKNFIKGDTEIDTLDLNDLSDFMFYLFRENIDIELSDEQLKNQFLMPYYMDFRKRGTGVASVKDQLFFKETYNCAENNSFYGRNVQFDRLKYPYLRGFNYSDKCEDIDYYDLCKNDNGNPEGRLCYKKCCEKTPPDGGNKPNWCPKPEPEDSGPEASGVMPIYDYLSNKIYTDEYPIDSKNSKLNTDIAKEFITDIEKNKIKDESRQHGFYKVDERYVDPNYKGYYIDELE